MYGDPRRATDIFNIILMDIMLRILVNVFRVFLVAWIQLIQSSMYFYLDYKIRQL